MMRERISGRVGWGRAWAIFFALVLLPLGMAPSAALAAEPSDVVVNARPLQSRTVEALERAYRATIPTGRYWYDPVSGLWGQEGGPGIGQIAPRLPLGGPLRADASGGGTGVFVNGREIHPDELAYLRHLYGEVRRGRYWLNPYGIAGHEGGPPQFDLRRAAGAAGYNRDTPGGSLMSDGACGGYLHPDGPTVMFGDC
jgi:hypothetical protein